MKFDMYSVWTDPVFYAAVAVFALTLFLLVFSIRKYLEIKNNADFDPQGEGNEEVQAELPLAEVQEERETAAPEPEQRAEPAAAAGSPSVHHPSRAEEFVQGLYERLASLDNRVRNIETDFAKVRVNRDFTVKFLEDMTTDFDSLDKQKIKARIEYLLADLKK